MEILETDPPPGSEPHPGVRVRGLDASDLERVVAIDARITGRRRDEFFRLKMQRALGETGVALSLAADVDARCAGFLLARVDCGEFGRFEKVAVLDTIGVHPDFKGKGVAAALLDQLRTNLLGLGVPRLQTEIGWDDLELLAFFHRAGFTPAPRFCLDLDLERARREDESGRRWS
jgi:GNAT superfamily N-acetyltransferase